MDFGSKPLFILDMANNHMGQLEHGERIVEAMATACAGFDEFRVGIKFQYRQLDSFIHPDYRHRTDYKYVKRFSETRLPPEDYAALVQQVKAAGFVAICTPFDEASVELIEEHGFDVLKIASCSFTDWPLLERVGRTRLPVVASTAGASLEQMDRVASFLEHRMDQFALMHCVGEYPTSDEHLELNQLDLMIQRYAGVPVGFSTHEDPDNTEAVMVAVAKGARLLERHVGLAAGGHSLNAYSSGPEQVRRWLQAARRAFTICGVAGRRREMPPKELHDLQGLRRGVFASRDIAEGEKVTVENTFCAIPNLDGQLVANEMSKYLEYTAARPLAARAPVLAGDVTSRNVRQQVVAIVNRLRELLIQSQTRLPNRLELELSHHYGIDDYYEWGGAIINIVNREYCKKLILLLAGQKHPAHAHKRKEETFHILHGDMTLDLDGQQKRYGEGDLVTVERGVMHHFSSEQGVVVEEISTTHYKDDSYYEDPRVAENPRRKTHLTFWSDWLVKPIT